MDLDLKDKRVLVTGSSSGIGAGIAAVLAAEGAWVLVHGRDAARTEAVASQLRAGGARCSMALGELSTDEGADAVAAVASREMGGIDVLINNAGGKTAAGNPDWFDVPLSDWLATYEQNVGAAVRLVHRLVPGIHGVARHHPDASGRSLAGRRGAAARLARRRCGNRAALHARADSPVREPHRTA
jgi:NADP-dependent 3-hydroxy acid dehydrogenase YdfG